MVPEINQAGSKTKYLFISSGLPRKDFVDISFNFGNAKVHIILPVTKHIIRYSTAINGYPPIFPLLGALSHHVEQSWIIALKLEIRM